jgi:S-adenosylmethionine:tRNA ribosyltransferase-isomerase
MQTRDFDYELPPELIAQAPLPERGASRLLELEGGSGRVRDLRFADLPALLQPGDLLVFNDTRVLPARLSARKSTGGRVELLLERLTGPRSAWVQIRASHAPQIGAELQLADGVGARITERREQLYAVVFSSDAMRYFEAHGETPLPPYIERAANLEDRDRYQTVFARVPGAVAAPTAGLHFDAPMLAALATRGIEHAFVTLHVGLGTFEPVRSERVAEHRLHAERLAVSAAVCERVRNARARGGRIVAVGTTVVRALESAAAGGQLAPFDGETALFVYPGFGFRVVDALLTNFHLPRSSLLMLVAAFAGREATLAAYGHAVRQRYRFFSYGDAMFVTPTAEARCGDAL